MSEEYICVHHGHSACPDCAKEFKTLEQEALDYRKALEDIEVLGKNDPGDGVAEISGGDVASAMAYGTKIAYFFNAERARKVLSIYPKEPK